MIKGWPSFPVVLGECAEHLIFMDFQGRLAGAILFASSIRAIDEDVAKYTIS
jgi:hypothetical protein